MPLVSQLKVLVVEDDEGMGEAIGSKTRFHVSKPLGRSTRSGNGRRPRGCCPNGLADVRVDIEGNRHHAAARWRRAATMPSGHGACRRAGFELAIDETGSSRVTGKRMRRLALAALAWGALGPALAQGPTPAGKAAATTAAPGAVELDKLTGAWVRPDGGYVILIKGAAANGELQASYFNPNPLPFATAMARRDGEALRVTFELRAGGYNGSLYELRYDAATDRLTGTFYQAVAKQTYGVQFSRK